MEEPIRNQDATLKDKKTQPDSNNNVTMEIAPTRTTTTNMTTEETILAVKDESSCEAEGENREEVPDAGEFEEKEEGSYTIPGKGQFKVSISV